MTESENNVLSDARQGVPFALLIASNVAPVVSTDKSLMRKAREFETFLDSRPSLHDLRVVCFTTHGGPTVEDTTKDTIVHDGNNTYTQPDDHTDHVDQEPNQED
jgi:hypothetical protein